MNIELYLQDVIKIYQTGRATENSYRAPLEKLFCSISEDVQAINEPKRVKCGAPDFMFYRGDVMIGHAEAKDIDKDLSAFKGHDKEQKERFLKALPNLIYTNCLDFEFYQHGELINRISIADYMVGIHPKPENYEALKNQLTEFAQQRPQTITSAENLAELMAGKAVLIKDILYNTLRTKEEPNLELKAQYQAFEEHLIHDISLEDFSDIYAETIAYGMFAARLHDPTPEDFSRQEALELLPKSNPFLRNLFSYIAGPNLDDRLKWIIDGLADIFQACDLQKLMENFGSFTQRNDPFIHFYETFLAKYNPKKRKARGVWYTPEPVVSFIVRAVDEVLKNEFALPLGLADTSKVTVDWDTGQRAMNKDGTLSKRGKNAVEKKEVHRVQILDPATGTGTFLAEAIKQIAPQIQNIASGQWSQYVEENLISRLHGFELLMASYAMCHTKLDMVLSELEYRPSKNPPRFSVFLTNALEEGEPPNQALPFARWLSDEARQANDIKRDMPIMCVIGNPPYSGESSNKGEYAKKIIEPYKKEPGGKIKLQERNIKWLSDDYVKFIRLGEKFIDENNEGVLAFITNHAYLDNPTFRGMRWHLLKTFDKIYILDLHGNAKKKETCPDGSADKNVFDIQQGVSIIVAVKKKKSADTLAKIYHSDLWGKRQSKNDALNSATLENINWHEIEYRAPWYFFVPVDYESYEEYQAGLKLDDLFPVNSVGIVTARDHLTIQRDKQSLIKTIEDFAALEPEQARIKYDLGKDARDWKVNLAQKELNDTALNEDNIVPISYRPFDKRWTYFTGKSKGFHCMPRGEVMKHMLYDNIAIVTVRRVLPNKAPVFIFLSDTIISNGYIRSDSVSIDTLYPLYTYNPMGKELIKEPNLNTKLFGKFKNIVPDITPENLFDYIYGILHAPEYRSRYAAYLKSDFPRIPLPESAEYFHEIAGCGERLRHLHLMDSKAVGEANYPFIGEGESHIKCYEWRDGHVWINDHQHFKDVPEKVWDFYIGGYRPAYKWLKDREGEALSFDDILHYQKIIEILKQTMQVMADIPFK